MYQASITNANDANDKRNFSGKVRSLDETRKEIMDEQKCFVVGKPTCKNFKNDHDIVKYRIELRNLKEEAKDEDEESGIDDDESHSSGGVLSQTLENKMAAADCPKSQDSSTDTVEMQGLKEVLDKASKKPLIKEDTW